MAGQNHGKMRDKRKSPPLSIRLLPAYHDPQVRDAIEGNPKGIVSSSPGLRACELPWDIMQTASQPQRGCGRARHPRTQPRWGWSVLTRWTQGNSLLATLCCGIPSGFARFLTRDVGNDVPPREERDGEKRQLPCIFPLPSSLFIRVI